MFAGCGGGGEPRGLGAKTQPTPTPTNEVDEAANTFDAETRQATPRKRPVPPPPKAALAAARKLPLAQRVGQLFLVGWTGTDLSASVFEELAGHGWGGISIAPANAPTGDLYALYGTESRAVAEAAGRVAPFVLAQLDGGPEKLGSNPKEGRSNAAASSAASEVASITLAIQPRINVGLGADAKLISRVAPEAVRGWLQGNVATAVAHFPGQGIATQDPLDGPAAVRLSPAELAERDLLPFRTALRRSPAVTVSSATFTAYDAVTPAAQTPAIVRDLLRRKLRFRGMAMTDDLAGVVAATGQSRPRAAIKALQAGIDMVYIPAPRVRGAVYEAVLKAARSGAIPAARITEAAARVLAAKQRVGVFSP